MALPINADVGDDDVRHTDGVEYAVSTQLSVSDGDNTPFWLNANKYGLSSVHATHGYLRASLARPLANDSTKRCAWGAMVDVAAAFNYTSNFVVQQAYVEGRWNKGVLTLGSKEYPMELKNQQLSTGSQTLGINARPVPQARLALPDYWVVPGTKGWISVKGHIAYGKTTDEGWQKDFTMQKSRFTEDVLYHSKAGYLKIGNTRQPSHVSLVVGLEMASQFAGSSYVLADDGHTIVKLENDRGA